MCANSMLLMWQLHFDNWEMLYFTVTPSFMDNPYFFIFIFGVACIPIVLQNTGFLLKFIITYKYAPMLD